MALGREVDHGIYLFGGQQSGDQRPIADITAHETVTRVLFQTGEVGQVARVSQQIEIDDPLFALVEHQPYKIRPNESGASGDQYVHGAAAPVTGRWGPVDSLHPWRSNCSHGASW